jgi:release factor glutamine methyltransferase
VSVESLEATINRIMAVAQGSARLEARLLCETAAGNRQMLEGLILRRLAGEPVDRIIGHRGFWTLDLLVSPAVLSPRPDTETVVELARDLARQRFPAHQKLRILDLGTGSGAILLALLSEFPDASGLGIDISPAALDIAERNAALNALSGRALFKPGSWGEGITEHFDIIVSNPPYIPTGELAALEREVRNHDPHLALDGGKDGLDPYRAIFPQLHHLLKPEGIAVFEIGYGQDQSIPALATASNLYCLQLKADLSRIPRALAVAIAG